jgi:hypothetical protein
MMTVLYHTTDAAEVILHEGFRDGVGSYLFARLTLRGVFLSPWPVDINEGATGDQVLEVTLPDDVTLDEYAIEEEDRPAWEWCVPAAVINERGRLRLLTDDELDALVDRR